MRAPYAIASLRELNGIARPKESRLPLRAQTASHSQIDISIYKGRRLNSDGLVQRQDKIVDRFALTIYPYSLGLLLRSIFDDCHSMRVMLSCPDDRFI